MLRFFWPTKLNGEPDTLTRFGRVLHWIATALALLAASLGVLLTITSVGSGREAGIVLGSSFAIIVYFAGRALRYVFSGE